MQQDGRAASRPSSPSGRRARRALRPTPRPPLAGAAPCELAAECCARCAPRSCALARASRVRAAPCRWCLRRDFFRVRVSRDSRPSTEHRAPRACVRYVVSCFSGGRIRFLFHFHSKIVRGPAASSDPIRDMCARPCSVIDHNSYASPLPPTYTHMPHKKYFFAKVVYSE